MLCVATALMAAMLGLFAAVGHDQLWCLYVAQRMLRGVQLYGPELLESNPPLIMAMLLIPARAAQILGIPDTVAFKFFVVLIAAGSAAASYRLLRRRPEFRVPAGRWAGLFAFLAIFGVVPARDLGQREHLLALLCLPYVLAAVLDFSPAENRVRLGALARMAIGFAAGVGLCLKPHHLLVPAAIEAAILLKRRVFLPRIEPLAILATCLAYVAAIRVFTPLYLTSILPILRDTYWAIGHLPPSRLLGEAIELHVLGIVTLAIYLRGGRRDPYVTLLLLAGAASTVAYYLQGTGWYYQQLPAISLFGVALFFELAQLAVDRRWSLPKWMPATTAALCVLAVGLTAYFSGYTFARPLSFPSGLSDTPDPTFFAGLPPGTPVAILTSGRTIYGRCRRSCATSRPAAATRRAASPRRAWPNWTACSICGWSKTSPAGSRCWCSWRAARTPPYPARSSKTGMTTCWRGSRATRLSAPRGVGTASCAPRATTTRIASCRGSDKPVSKRAAR
jgi:hypothetical protein